MPDIELPNGKLNDPTIPRWRASVCEPCDRISIYLNQTVVPRLSSASAQPNPMEIELRIGLDCLEERIFAVQIFPKTLRDGGHLFTWSTPQLFDSIVITGTTIAANALDPLQSLSLRTFVDRAGIYSPANPLLGALTTP